MVKAQRGLPADFDLNVSAPVELGDYLDEVQPVQPIVTARGPRVDERVIELREDPPRLSPEVIMPHPAPPPMKEARPPAAPSSVPLRTPERAAVPVTRVPPEEGTGFKSKPPRREINMNAETAQMFEVLLQMVRQYTGQTDTKGSEVFEALVSLVFRAKEELDLGTVPARGQWGSPTARAFPVSLSHAFERAIASHFEKLTS